MELEFFYLEMHLHNNFLLPVFVDVENWFLFGISPMGSVVITTDVPNRSAAHVSTVLILRLTLLELFCK